MASRSKNAKFKLDVNVILKARDKINFANTTMGNDINVLENDVIYMEKNLWYGGERSSKVYTNLKKTIISCREINKELDKLSTLVWEMAKKLPTGG